MPTPRAGWLGAVLVLIAAALFGSLGVARAVRLRRRRPAVRVRGLARRRRRAGHRPRRGRDARPARRRGRASSAPAAAPRRALALGDGARRGAEPVDVPRVRPDDGRAGAARLLHVSSDGRGRERPARARAARSRPRGRTRASRSPGMVAVVLGGLGSTEAVRVDALGILLGLVGGRASRRRSC